MSVALYGPGFNIFFGDDLADSVSAVGVRTAGVPDFFTPYSYSYGVNACRPG